jgi:hypothetical protein
MDATAGSPAELETLLEDAVLLGDDDAMARLFERHALVVPESGREARGRAAIAAATGDLGGYVADPRRVARSGHLALVVGPASVNVVRRTRHSGWRYVICLLGPQAGGLGST